MKVLTLNFLTCAVKACKSTSAAFPLHPKDCELVSDTLEANPKLLYNILPRIDWNALIITASEVCFVPFPSSLIYHFPLKKRTKRNDLTPP
jgi:multifunctional methyltransferase subunit TRM112